MELSLEQLALLNAGENEELTLEELAQIGGAGYGYGYGRPRR